MRGGFVDVLPETTPSTTPANFGDMFGIGGWEMLLIAVVALLVFGPKRLPELARQLGKGLSEFRHASSELRRSFDLEMDPRKTPAPASDTQPPAQAGDVAQPVLDAGPSEDATGGDPGSQADSPRAGTPAEASAEVSTATAEKAPPVKDTPHRGD